MLWVLRLLALAVGAFTAYRVLGGQVAASVFKVPELAAGAALIISALLPRHTAPGAMTAASAYSLGVFSIVLSSYLTPGRPVDPLLIAMMAVNLTTVLLLMPRGGHH